MRTTLFHRSVLLAASLAAAPLCASVLHDFNNQPLLTTLTTAGSTISVSTAPGVNAAGLRLDYNLTAGPFVRLLLDSTGHDTVALGATALRFQYRMTGPAQTMEVELVDGDNASNNLSDKAKAVFNPIVDGVWHSTTVPLASFSNLTLSGNGVFNNRQIAQFIFIVSRGAGADGSGSVYLDNFEFVNAGGNSLRVLETFSFNKNDVIYEEWAEEGTFPVSIETDVSVPGASAGNRVGRMDYVLTPSINYGGFVRVLNANFLVEPTVRFQFNGTGGDNTLDVKLTDIDGTVFIKKLTEVTNTGGVWKTASIPANQFSFFAAGGDGTLNLKRVTGVEFAIVRGEAKKGVLVLDNLESVFENAFEKSGVGSVLASYATPANPFSPNGDGRKDVFTINYTLNEDARVVLRVFNLQGVPIKTVDGGNQAAGDRVLTWDGLGDDGGMVANGIYFTVFEVDGVASGKDTLKNVVGVVR